MFSSSLWSVVQAIARRWDRRWWAIGLLLAGTALCLRPLILAPAHQRLLWQAADALIRQQYEQAERLAVAVLQERPASVTAWLIAGEAAARNQRSEAALAYLACVPESHPAEYAHAQYLTATRLLILGRAVAAEQALRRVLALDPQHQEANQRLAVLLQTEGRTWESLAHAQRLVLGGRCDRDELLMIGGANTMMVHDPDFVETCLRAAPDDPLVLLGRARMDLIDNRSERAEATLRRIIQRDPGQTEAQARLGEILLQKPASAEFLQWQAALPADADSHPLVWYVRGLWAKRNGQPQAAVRCFLEALRRQPNHSSAGFQLSQVLIALGQPAAAEPFAEKARTLSKLEYLLHELRALPDVEMMRQVAELQLQSGRWWEAAGWAHVALSLESTAGWAQAILAQPLQGAAACYEFTRAAAQPALAWDIDAYPLPEWPPAQTGGASAATAHRPVDGSVRWVDMAADSGLDFRYFNGTEADQGLGHILETTGGGVAVLDYDGDGWPDLYLVQSGRWEQRGAASPYRDRLFRNRGDGRFEDITERAGLGAGDFGQGVTAGDYNSDGWPDLYVANVGRNRLYENNGDGTFREITDQAGVAGEAWSTSCALVDLNADGLPEIYVVNYLALDEVLARQCQQQGHPMGCSPTMFPAEQDRLYHNLGDGRFQDVTEQSGIRVADGKGLGVVAADFDGSGRINLFVGNDTTANFYFVNQTPRPGGSPQFLEQGILSGLAFNEAGQAQACMGIAADDVDGNGLLDLFVANFYADSNTLYLQSPGAIFTDQTRRAGLREPSFHMLTFGLQFLDGELDGRLDILASNGHVDRSIDGSVPDLMPPQYFQNLGQGRFAELSGQSLGAYFQREYLGRTVAVLDWNRDGREDACVSHLDVPVALLTNHTPAVGHYLAVRLHGVVSNRDALGAILEVTAGDQVWTRYLCGGNGYQASNERRIVFGLGPVQRVDRLRVRWPAGSEQLLTDLDVDQEITLVEGGVVCRRGGPPD